MWYFAVYVTIGAIVILLMSMTKDFVERWQRVIHTTQGGLGPFEEDHAVDLILFGVVTVFLLAWPTLPAAFALQHLKRRDNP